MQAWKRNGWLALLGLALGLSIPLRCYGIDRIFVVSGEASGADCPEAIVIAKQDALARAAEMCDNFSLLSIRYLPNNPDDSCARTESGEHAMAISMEISCPVVQ